MEPNAILRLIKKKQKKQNSFLSDGWQGGRFPPFSCIALQQPQLTLGRVSFPSAVNSETEKWDERLNVVVQGEHCYSKPPASKVEFFPPLSLASLNVGTQGEQQAYIYKKKFLPFHDWHQKLTFAADVLWSLKHFGMSDSSYSELEVCQQDVMFSVWSCYPQRTMHKRNCHTLSAPKNSKVKMPSWVYTLYCLPDGKQFIWMRAVAILWLSQIRDPHLVAWRPSWCDYDTL